MRLLKLIERVNKERPTSTIEYIYALCFNVTFFTAVLHKPAIHWSVLGRLKVKPIDCRQPSCARHHTVYQYRNAAKPATSGRSGLSLSAGAQARSLARARSHTRSRSRHIKK